MQPSATSVCGLKLLVYEDLSYKLSYKLRPAVIVIVKQVARIEANIHAVDEALSIRQHTSAYVSIRQHTTAYTSIRKHTSAYVSIHQHT
jgi:hypothetical protein